MPFDGSGIYNRNFPPGGWQGDAAASIKIKADRHDIHDGDLATALSFMICKDGQSTVGADIPWNSHKITGLANPTSPQDAATKNYVDAAKTFSTGINITGADSGVSWTLADMSWIGRDFTTNQSSKRLAVNDKADGTGTDVCYVDENGNINNKGSLSNNASYDGSAWRTIAAGIASWFSYTGGVFTFQSNDTATTTAYQTATPRTFLTAQNITGTVNLILDKSASAKTAQLVGRMATKNRWVVTLGNTTAETATERVGSDFQINSYNNDGTGPVSELVIDRSSHQATFGGTVISATFQSPGANGIYAGSGGSGAVYLRPQGGASSTGQFVVDAGGTVTVSGFTFGGLGYKCRTGVLGIFGSNAFNISWAPNAHLWIDNSDLGVIAFTSDYRMKKDIRPLPSMWDKVKTLSPISYSTKAWKIFEKDDTPQWGFVAHELQEKLTQSAASGHKDAEDTIQSPNPWTVIAALTRALQEAMARIEVLEART